MPEEFIQRIAKESGKITLQFYKKSAVQYAKKHALDVVTQADLAVNEYVLNEIKNNFPQDGIVSEETGESAADAEYVWIIDPIDGTLNFSRSIPTFCILIARARRGEVELGVIYDPVHDDLYYAKKGEGAFLNGERIACSHVTSLDAALGVGSTSIKPEAWNLFMNIAQLSSLNKVSMIGLYCIGMSAAYIAAGRIDWYVMPGGAVWDHAAPSVILREAGCVVTNMEGEPWTLKDKEMVAANSTLHACIMSALNKK